MTDYILSMQAPTEHAFEAMHDVLALPTVEKIMFPMEIRHGGRSSIQVPSSTEFRALTIPNEFFFQNRVMTFSCVARNGITFHCTIFCPKPNILADVVKFTFSDSQVNRQVLTSDIIQGLFSEIVPAFGVDYGILYQEPPPARGQTYLAGSTRKIARELGWFTYFDWALVEHIGDSRFAELSKLFQMIELSSGVLVILQPELLQLQNPDHLDLLERAENFLFRDI
jgi:hypothetical protein